MECKNIQKLIEDFDYSRLSFKTNEEFVNHVSQCNDCKEELEIYYIVKYGLSEDVIIPNQIHANKNKQSKNEFGHLLDTLDFEGIVDLKLKYELESIKKIKQLRRYCTYSLLTTNYIMLMVILIWFIIKYW